MSGKINLLIDTIPYTPDIFNNTNSLYESDSISTINTIPTYQTIFIFCLSSGINSNSLTNQYNNPYYMLYGIGQSGTNYLLPPISYFSMSQPPTNFYSVESNLIKTIYKSYVFTPEILQLLNNIGFDTTLNSNGQPENLFTPNIFPNPPNSSPLFDNKILFQKISVYDACTGRNDEVIYIFFYQNYITGNIINTNNSYIYEPSEPKLTPFASTTFWNKKNYNVFIYPYLQELNSWTYTQPIYWNPISYTISQNSNNLNPNYVDSLNFNNRDYIDYLNKLDYKYFENHNFLMYDNKLNTMILQSKNLLSWSNYYSNQITNSENNIFISLNEINKYEPIQNLRTSNSSTQNSTQNLPENNNFSSNLTLKFLAKSKSYSNINNFYSLTYDNKMSYVNNKINTSNITYAPYKNGGSERTDTMYPIVKNFFINTYINIANLPTNLSTLNILLQTTNWYIRKLILQINSSVISNPNNIQMTIYPLTEPVNDLTTVPNSLAVQFNISVLNLGTTNNYYIDRFRIVVQWSETTTDREGNPITINWVYYLILNIGYYNQNYINIVNTTKTLSIDDLGYIGFTNLDNTISLSPTIFTKLENSNIYTNLVNYNLIDVKYNSFSLNYNQLSTNKTQYNLIFVNHFYLLIPYIKNEILYTTSITQPPVNIPISNVYNLLEKKINNFITNTIFLSDNFYSIKFNNYNAESIFKFSFVFDSNIITDYYSEEPLNPNLDYINYLTYIQNDFAGSVIPYVQPVNSNPNYSFSSIMIPSGNYLVFKYRNNFINRDSSGNPIEMSDLILQSIISSSEGLSQLSTYNYALLIKLNNDFAIDDTFFVSNQSYYSTINQYLCNQGNYQTMMYLVPCSTDYSLYYYGTSSDSDFTYLMGLELFNYYNGAISGTNSFSGNKIFINMFISQYMNFYTLNFIIDTWDTQVSNNKLYFDKNNIEFRMHKNKYIYPIVKYDSLRFNSQIPQSVIYWNEPIIINLLNNKNLISYMKVLNNNLLYLENCNKIITIFKKCIYYLRLIKNTIYFNSITQLSCLFYDDLCCISDCYQWNNHFLSINEYINIINYLATCVININKVNQIINITYCQEISKVDSILLNLVYLDSSITIQIINDYILELEFGMLFYVQRINLTQGEMNELFNKFDLIYNSYPYPIVEYSDYKTKYLTLVKEIYLNNIILYAINLDVITIFNNIKISQTIKPEIYDFILINLSEIVDIIEVYKLNINILSETLNFIRLFYYDHTVYNIYSSMNNTITKTNYIYNSEYYVSPSGCNLQVMDIFLYFPPDPLPAPYSPTLCSEIKNLITTLVQMISDTWKVNYGSLAPMFGYNIYTKAQFLIFIATIDNLVAKSLIMFRLPDIANPPNTYMKTYIYSWDIIQKFISCCYQIKVFIKAMFYLNKISKRINCNKFLYCLTNACEYISSIQNIYQVIKQIITVPQTVITQYQKIANALVEEITGNDSTIFPPNINYIFNPYNQYSILIPFLRGLQKYKITLGDKIPSSIFTDIFECINLGYQGEDIIPFNDYNLLIDQRSILYTIFPDPKNIYLPTANMHTFNSSQCIIELITIFNTNKKIINDYYLSFDNSEQQYSLIFNAINYGYIYTDYVFVNIDNVNT